MECSAKAGTNVQELFKSFVTLAKIMPTNTDETPLKRRYSGDAKRLIHAHITQNAECFYVYAWYQWVFIGNFRFNTVVTCMEIKSELPYMNFSVLLNILLSQYFNNKHNFYFCVIYCLRTMTYIYEISIYNYREGIKRVFKKFDHQF